MNKPWYQVLFDILAGLLTGQQLDKAKTSQEVLRGSFTMSADLPAFGGHNGPPEGVKESRDIEHCHPELIKRYMDLKTEFEAKTGQQLFETCTWRSKERQAELYEQGRTKPGKIVTKLDGFTRRSRHNVYPAEAVDVCVDSDPGPGKHAVWDPSAYEPLGALAIKHGLVWGGDWDRDGLSADEKFVDYPHLELPAEAA